MGFFDKKKAARWLAKKGFDTFFGKWEFTDIIFNGLEKHIEKESENIEASIKKIQKIYEGEISKLLNHQSVRDSLHNLISDADNTTTKNILSNIVCTDKHSLYAIPFYFFAHDAESTLYQYYSGCIDQYYKDIFPTKTLEEHRKVGLSKTLAQIGGFLTAANLIPQNYTNLKYGFLKRKSARTISYNDKYWLVCGSNHDKQWGDKMPKGHCYVRFVEFSEINKIDWKSDESTAKKLETHLGLNNYSELIDELNIKLTARKRLSFELSEKIKVPIQ